MKKVAVVYWSGTGNTEMMADFVKAGIEKAGNKATLLTSADFDASMVSDFDAIAFGCPSMGSEQLEETEFEPMFDEVIGELKDKRIALFGSYGWGDGEWMRNWTEQCEDAGAFLVAESVICNEAPDDTACEELESLGQAL